MKPSLFIRMFICDIHVAIHVFSLVNKTDVQEWLAIDRSEPGYAALMEEGDHRVQAGAYCPHPL